MPTKYDDKRNTLEVPAIAGTMIQPSPSRSPARSFEPPPARSAREERRARGGQPSRGGASDVRRRRSGASRFRG